MKKSYISILIPLFLWIRVDIQEAPNTRPAKDYALLFAVNDYQESTGLDDLNNPIKNAEEIAKELQNKYGFQTEIVRNPTLAVMKAKLEVYENKFKPGGGFNPKGQLLIFFSGHGIEQYGSGFFMPADGKPSDPFYTAIPFDLWRNRINAINCQHILVAIDACHSAYFDPNFKTRSSKEFRRKNEFSEKGRLLADHNAYKSRLFFTSDGKGDETPDRSGFAKKNIGSFSFAP